MKKIMILAGCVALLAACKQQSEEVKSDEVITNPPVETPSVPQDTVAETPQAPEATEAPTAVSEPKSPAAAVPSKSAAEKPAFKYASFGSKISSDKALSKDQMRQKYAALKKGDTVNVKFASTIMSVCKKKGCWMKMDLGESKESFVRFKDYGFFVPLNSDASPAIVSGKAFLDVISVDELKHYAKDGGKSQAEIDQITQPKITYAFQADGVLIQE